jgi:hypothetical protein
VALQNLVVFAHAQHTRTREHYPVLRLQFLCHDCEDLLWNNKESIDELCRCTHSIFRNATRCSTIRPCHTLVPAPARQGSTTFPCQSFTIIIIVTSRARTSSLAISISIVLDRWNPVTRHILDAWFSGLLDLANASGDPPFPRTPRCRASQVNKLPIWPGLLPGSIPLSSSTRAWESSSGLSWVNASQDVQCIRTNPDIYPYSLYLSEENWGCYGTVSRQLARLFSFNACPVCRLHISLSTDQYFSLALRLLSSVARAR